MKKTTRSTKKRSPAIRKSKLSSSAAQQRGQRTPRASEPPVAEQIPHQHKIHGDLREDPYYWLRERDTKPVLNYLRKENAYTQETLKGARPLRKKLVTEFKSRMPKRTASLPYQMGNFEYWVEYHPGEDYPRHYRRHLHATSLETVEQKKTNKDKTRKPATKKQLVLDVNRLAKGKSYCEVKLKVSPDHEWAAVLIDTVGRRKYDLMFLHIDSGKIGKQRISPVTPNFCWMADSNHFLVVRQDEDTLRYFQVLAGSQDRIQQGLELIYEEKDTTFSTFLSETLIDTHVFLICASTITDEIKFMPKTTVKNFHFSTLVARKRGREVSVDCDGKHYYLRSNEGAKNFRLVRTPVENPNWETAEVFLEHRADTMVSEFLVFPEWVAVNSRFEGRTQIELFPVRKDSQLKARTIEFKDPAHTLSFGVNMDGNLNYLRFEFESLCQPRSIYDWDFAKGAYTLRQVQEVPRYNAGKYRTERTWALSRDGKTRIPISLVMKKSHKNTGKNPIWIYGYGSYGAASDPWFVNQWVSLLDRGFVCAVAHIRGGSEMGRDWTDKGRTHFKLNTFFDFIDATEHLVKEGYAHPNKVFAYGGSAGGLLMGVVANQRPDLYRGMIAAVPFVDAITTMLDESIPLTTSEYDEWGNPNVKEDYFYIKAYSPYDNVRSQTYPNLLVTTGYHDSQVQYWEPAKWIAKLRCHQQGTNKILLWTDLEAGHSGRTGRFSSLEDAALRLSFPLWVLSQKQKSVAKSRRRA